MVTTIFTTVAECLWVVGKQLNNMVSYPSFSKQARSKSQSTYLWTVFMPKLNERYKSHWKHPKDIPWSIGT